MVELEPIQVHESVADRVYGSLREAIASLVLRPGQPLVESELARQLGVSATPVREALRRLHERGLVSLSRYRGATVMEITERDVREVYQLRIVVEPFATRLAVPNLTPDDIDELDRVTILSEAAHRQGNFQELSRYNRRFHGVFFARCENMRLQQVLENLQDLNRMIALLTWEDAGFDPREHQEHLLILDAARAGNADAAAAALQAHIERFARLVEERWAGRDG